MKPEKVKLVLGIVISWVVLIGVGIQVYRHFAKTAEVETIQKDIGAINTRVDISIVDDQIFQQEQDILRMKVEQRHEPMTPQEEELLQIQRQRLDDLKQKKKEKLELYEKGS